MFRTGAVNPFDEAVSTSPLIFPGDLSNYCAIAKATDENLTAENWELILDVCDKVDAKPEEGYAYCVLVSDT
jgi:hypothetical protein